MTTEQQQESSFEVKERERISAVWLVPLIALIFGAWLLFKAISERGVFITVQFDSAMGIVAGKTEVRYKGLTAGLVTGIDVSEDLQSVIVEIEMINKSARSLTDKALFWYVTADVSVQRVSGLDTLFSGSYINFQPDIKEEGKEQRHFIGLDQPPAQNLAVPGLHITLQTDSLGSLARDSSVTFRQIKVGYITGFDYDDSSQLINVNAFIEPEYAHLVKQNSRFWNASGIEASASLSSGVKLRTQSLASIISGGVAFDDPAHEALLSEAKNGDEFPLYASFQSAELAHEIELILNWDSGIDVGAAIMYQGINLGVVDSVTDIDTEQRKITAKAKVDPRMVPYLKEQTALYVVSPEVDFKGVTNIQTVLLGPHIGIRPSTEGEPRSSFTVYNRKPAYNYSEPGLHLVLSATNVASIHAGTGIFYKKNHVGSVQGVEALGPDEFLVHIFIKPEYQHYVAADSRFWNASGMKISGGLQKFEVKAHSLQTMLAGGITFDKGLGKNQQRVKNGDLFALFADDEIAKQRVLFELSTAPVNGLKAQTRIMYRGQQIGSVHAINSHRQESILEAGILPEFEFLLRQHSQFWLAKPRLSLSGLTDTDALFGGAYISVNLGQGEEKRHFTLLDNPPEKHASHTGLQLTLTADNAQVAMPGSQISYLGITVGQVDNVALSGDEKSVDLHISIDEAYRHLIRADSRFYNASGITVSGNLGNFIVKTESMDSLLTGGISFYNPQSQVTSLPVAEGDNFTLYHNIEHARSAGSTIVLHFDDVSALKANMKIKYHDQQVGLTERVIFDKNGYGAKVIAFLNDDAAKFTRIGAKFWLSKPELGLVGTKHLDAILEGGFISALPGDINKAVKNEFTAEQMPPVVKALPYGLNVELSASRLGSVRVGDPVLYRQVKVGKVIGVDLAASGDKVSIFINIPQRYAPLVTAQSKFWNASGITLEGGVFSGVDIRSESLETLLAGGIAFATPEPGSNGGAEAVDSGKIGVFTLYDKVRDEWLEWRPKLFLQELSE
ncbi:PqiB family protein [Thalassomonas actiniarum]|uniref:MCE family protein n=1 Tax=Thalassomonas actiniarum TaxID=485447 RepID=A0AAF0C3R5_9GAMM|nr:MlaD family protein [Thalassomonas actiniarum]WDD99248.1 MCE family protein [Thalassomonas actiniarum]